MRFLLPLFLLPVVALAQVTSNVPSMSLEKEGVFVSNPTSVEEAEATALTTGPGEYVLIRPNGTILVQAPEPPVDLTEDLVYTRIPRTQEVPEDARDRIPDTGRMYHSFSGQGQMVIRVGGVETVVYDCTGQPCLPFDYSDSPDGTKIAFSVYRSDSLDDGRYLSRSGNEAQIHIYDRETEEITAWPHEPGEHQTNPVFLPDGSILYSTDIDGHYEPALKGKSPGRDPVPQMHIAASDGSGSIPISPHEVSGALHPIVLSTGRVAYSQFWLSHNLPYIYTNGRNQGFATLPNMWTLGSMDIRGGDPHALLGAHKFQFVQDGTTRTQKSLHFMTERVNGDICTGNYYRSNNFGLGDVDCFTPMAKGIEGVPPKFAPENLYSVANWSVSNDNVTKDDTKAKIGYPEAHPDGGLIVAMGQGLCSTVQLDNKHAQQPGRIGCDVGLYKTTQIPSLAVTDMEAIVDSPLWHEFAAKVIAPWSVAEPEILNTDDGSCELASSDVWSTDAYPRGDYEFNKWHFEAANNGSRLPLVDQTELAAIRLYEVEQNFSKKSSSKAKIGAVGHRLRLMGDIPLLADKSFKASVPCDVPYVMAGVDADGHVIMRDQVPQSLRPGEKRVCTGCHLHGEEGRPFEDSLAATAEAFELLSSTPTPTWADIKPIIEAKFAQCGVPTDYDDLVWDSKQQAIPEDRRLITNPGKSGTKPYWLERPQLSLFIDSMYARKSLLYWMAVGERTDGLTDDQFDDDIDYAGWCDAGATEAEANTIKHWIDAGSVE